MDRNCEFDDELDHPLHEFAGLRPARPDDIEALAPNGTVAQLAARFASGPQGFRTNAYYPQVDSTR